VDSAGMHTAAHHQQAHGQARASASAVTLRFLHNHWPHLIRCVQVSRITRSPAAAKLASLASLKVASLSTDRLPACRVVFSPKMLLSAEITSETTFPAEGASLACAMSIATGQRTLRTITPDGSGVNQFPREEPVMAHARLWCG
jgi:hypothetical protein